MSADGLLNTVKVVLKSLIISSPTGITVSQLNKDYRDMEGRSIPYSLLGFSNLDLFLRSIPDTLFLQTSSRGDPTVHAVVSENTKHIDQMVAEQKMPQNNRRSRYIPLSRHNVQSNSSNQSTNSQNNRSSNNSSYSNQNRGFQSQNQNNYNGYQNQYQCNGQQRNNMPFLQTMQNPYQQNGLLPIPSAQFLNIFQQIQQHNQLQQFQQRTFNQNYSSNHGPSNALPTKYYHNRSNGQQNGTNNRAYPNTRNQYADYSVDDNKGHTRLRFHNKSTHRPETNGIAQTKCNMIPAGEESSDSSDNFELSSPQKNMESTNQIASKTDNKQFANDTSIESKENNVDQISQLAKVEVHENGENNVSDTDTILAPVGNINLNDRVVPHDDAADENNCDNAIPELAEDDPIFFMDIPKEVARYGKSILPAVLPDKFDIGFLFQLFVAEVNNPYKFWFHVNEDDNRLDMLMYQIEHFYCNIEAHDLALSSNSMLKDQVCTALYSGQWHRAIILEIVTAKVAKCYFVDYGTVTNVELKNLKYLLTEFCQLPAQVYRGSLDKINPIGIRWSRNATYAFLTLVSNFCLFARITDINYDDKIVHMILIDTNHKNDVQINDELIKRGHAVLRNNSDCKLLHKRHYNEKYPTFEMLERGEYPSFSEIGQLLAKGIDFESLEDEKVLPIADANIAAINQNNEEFLRDLDEEESTVPQTAAVSYKNPFYRSFSSRDFTSHQMSSIPILNYATNPFLQSEESNNSLSPPSSTKMNGASVRRPPPGFTFDQLNINNNFLTKHYNNSKNTAMPFKL